MRLLISLLALASCLAAENARVDTSTPAGQAFARMYNFDFAGARAIVDRQIAQDPDVALAYAVKAATYMFSELYRLKILQTEFFQDDDRVVDRRSLKPDPAARDEFYRYIDKARERANARLATHPDDREALFALCMSSGLVTDFAALVERRRFGAFTLAKQTQAYVLKLLALNPPYYDAHLTAGSAEYVIGSLYFFVRWFVHIDGIEGNKQKGVEHLRIVAERGRYYGPFARVLLAVIAFREKRPQDAETLMAGLSADFPENPLFRQELTRARELMRASRPVVASFGSGGR